ncbi:MAG TPA: V-type ATP synthase subunit B [Myxococcales bacterium]|nr:V-type ATP synthase subunit B [Myxococcales bacterium]
MRREYKGASAAAGSLLFLRDARRVAMGEWVTVRVPGQQDRRGQVIDAGEEVTVVQVLEEMAGLQPTAAEISLGGETATAVVGRELLGRAFDGAGRPLDGLPPPVGDAIVPIWGAPMNPARRVRPADFIETGISAIDGLNTLVRGQKLPIFSSPGLPALELAAQIVESARPPRDEPFAVIFAGIGVTAREAQVFADRIQRSGAGSRSTLYLAGAGATTIERMLAPRVALSQAEHLAFSRGMHVLVVMADMAAYCEALREIGAAREEVPGRRAYPGYLYTDLASLFERAGIIEGREGSLTQLPVVTMPDDDITHPIPDLTGYITEGQIVLSRELHRRGIFPPIDVLPSLSRLMNAGIGKGRTAPEHRAWADQLYALFARGRDARLMSAIVGESGLGPADRRAMAFAERMERELIGQGRTRRTMAETLESGWQLLESMPREDLRRIGDALWRARQEARS